MKQKLRINTTADKESVKTRTDRAKVVADLTPKSAIFQAEPTLQGSGATLIKAGTVLADAESAVKAADAIAAKARDTRDTAVIEYDTAYAVYVATAQQHATTTEDVSSLGLIVLNQNSYPLAAPTSVEVTFDPVTEAIRIHVTHAPGMRACLTEISPDPIGATTWKQLTGVGATHTLTGYAPGTYWVRAASVRAGDQSGFTGPVSVIVK